NTVSQMYAKEAIQLTLAHLEKAVNSASSTKRPDSEARANMSRAANLAGKAINITATTACHAISYPFTSYFNVPHGHAVALTLGEMMVHNANVQKEDCLDGRGLLYVQNVMTEISQLFGFPAELSSAEKVREKINLLMEQIGLERNITKLGVKSEEDMQLILSNVNLERLKNNPRQLTSDELKKILKRLR
ncbi:MAG: iron-containing alcohol dehydrogenase, partial [Nanoarchaeota archaeon]